MNNILAVFAHPDDESFGPGGTLALLAKHYHVHLLYATKGEACSKDAKITRNEMKRTRVSEAQAAAEKIGAKSITFLNFKDGGLGNKHIADIEKKMRKEVTTYNISSIITFEPMGFSGHLDHIAVTTAAIQSYNRVRQIRALHLFGITHEQRNLLPRYFIPIPPGYSKESYGLIVDVSTVWAQKKAAIAQYISQSGDIKFWEPMLEGYDKHEHFIVQAKDKFTGWPEIASHIMRIG